jgi:hypothetical protein
MIFRMKKSQRTCWNLPPTSSKPMKIITRMH